MTKKKPQLIKKTVKPSMNLKQFVRNLKENDIHYENKQITQCVFLGVLRLKPVPSIFRPELVKRNVSKLNSKTISNLKNVNVVDKSQIKKQTNRKPIPQGKITKKNPAKIKQKVEKMDKKKSPIKIKLCPKKKSNKDENKTMNKKEKQKNPDSASKQQKKKTSPQKSPVISPVESPMSLKTTILTKRRTYKIINSPKKLLTTIITKEEPISISSSSSNVKLLSPMKVNPVQLLFDKMKQKQAEENATALSNKKTNKDTTSPNKKIVKDMPQSDKKLAKENKQNNKKATKENANKDFKEKKGSEKTISPNSKKTNSPTDKKDVNKGKGQKRSPLKLSLDRINEATPSKLVKLDRQSEAKVLEKKGIESPKKARGRKPHNAFQRKIMPMKSDRPTVTVINEINSQEKVYNLNNEDLIIIGDDLTVPDDLESVAASDIIDEIIILSENIPDEKDDVIFVSREFSPFTARHTPPQIHSDEIMIANEAKVSAVKERFSPRSKQDNPQNHAMKEVEMKITKPKERTSPRLKLDVMSKKLPETSINKDAEDILYAAEGLQKSDPKIITESSVEKWMDSSTTAIENSPKKKSGRKPLKSKANKDCEKALYVVDNLLKSTSNLSSEFISLPINVYKTPLRKSLKSKVDTESVAKCAEAPLSNTGVALKFTASKLNEVTENVSKKVPTRMFLRSKVDSESVKAHFKVLDEGVPKKIPVRSNVDTNNSVKELESTNNIISKSTIAEGSTKNKPGQNSKPNTSSDSVQKVLNIPDDAVISTNFTTEDSKTDIELITQKKKPGRKPKENPTTESAVKIIDEVVDITGNLCNPTAQEKEKKKPGRKPKGNPTTEPAVKIIDEVIDITGNLSNPTVQGKEKKKPGRKSKGSTTAEPSVKIIDEVVDITGNLCNPTAQEKEKKKPGRKPKDNPTTESAVKIIDEVIDITGNLPNPTVQEKEKKKPGRKSKGSPTTQSAVKIIDDVIDITGNVSNPTVQEKEKKKPGRKSKGSPTTEPAVKIIDEVVDITGNISTVSEKEKKRPGRPPKLKMTDSCIEIAKDSSVKTTRTSSGKYNPNVFQDPEAIDKQIAKLTGHSFKTIDASLEPPIEISTVLIDHVKVEENAVKRTGRVTRANPQENTKTTNTSKRKNGKDTFFPKVIVLDEPKEKSPEVEIVTGDIIENKTGTEEYKNLISPSCCSTSGGQNSSKVARIKPMMLIKEKKPPSEPTPLIDLYEFDESEIEEVLVFRTPSPKKQPEKTNVAEKIETSQICLKATSTMNMANGTAGNDFQTQKRARGRPKKIPELKLPDLKTDQTEMMDIAEAPRGTEIIDLVGEIESVPKKIEVVKVSEIVRVAPPPVFPVKTASPIKSPLKQQTIKDMFEAYRIKKEKQAEIDAIFARPAPPPSALQLSPKENLPKEAFRVKPENAVAKSPLMEANSQMIDEEEDDYEEDTRSNMEWLPEDYAEYKMQYSAKKMETYKPIFKCKVCLMMCQSYYLLNKHKLTHEQIEKPYKCALCEDSFKEIDIFNAHLRGHKGKEPYTCKKCRKGFDTKEELEAHEPIHVLKKAKAVDKKFRCDVCAKEFGKLCDMERHTRVHTGEKPSVCNICHKRFQQSYNLSKHLITHLHVKPFHCEICNKQFGRNDVLNRHLLTHSVEKPFKCEYCKKGFIRQMQLAKHMSKLHNAERASLPTENAEVGATTS